MERVLFWPGGGGERVVDGEGTERMMARSRIATDWQG